MTNKVINNLLKLAKDHETALTILSARIFAIEDILLANGVDRKSIEALFSKHYEELQMDTVVDEEKDA